MSEKFRSWPRYSQGINKTNLHRSGKGFFYDGCLKSSEVDQNTHKESVKTEKWKGFFYESRLKSSDPDQDTLMECEQISFIFRHSTPCGLATSSVGVAVLGFHESKKSSTARMTIPNELFSL